MYTAALEGRFREVHRAADAVDALCLVEDRLIAARLDLVIFAHHWAGMSGPDFVAELNRRLPAVPLLILGTDRQIAENYHPMGAQVGFLPTPVTAQKLVETVGAMLAQSFRSVA